MKKIFLAVFLIFSTVIIANETAITFPDIIGFEKDGDISVYDESNLYEYIDGAADGYIQLGFKKLTVQIYTKNEDTSFTVDIYEMKDTPSGFGIFKKEKSTANSISIGSDGYYENGMLNFYKGKYYVKLSSFGLGENDKKILNDSAKLISEQLKVEKKKTMFDCFPIKNRVPNSEQYIGNDFLGHGFLHSAFTVKLTDNNIEINPFIIKTKNPAEIIEIINNYKSLLKKKNKVISFNENMMSFYDPYYRNSGKMYLLQKDNVIIGLFSKNEEKAISLIKTIEKKIKEIDIK